MVSNLPASPSGKRRGRVIQSTARKQADDPLVTHRIHEQSLDNQARRQGDEWRQRTVSGLLRVFYVVNGFVLSFLFVVWVSERHSHPDQHIFTERTLLALIAGSTAQLGALALFVGRVLVQRTSTGVHGDS